MPQPFICPQLCAACEPCEARIVCKPRAIVQIDPGEQPYIALERCSRCGACLVGCVHQAIVMAFDGVEPFYRCEAQMQETMGRNSSI